MFKVWGKGLRSGPYQNGMEDFSTPAKNPVTRASFTSTLWGHLRPEVGQGALISPEEFGDELSHGSQVVKLT